MIWPKPSCFQFFHQLLNVRSECVQELFKPSKDSASLRVCIIFWVKS